MRKILASLIMLVALLFSLTPVALAGTQGSACSGGDTAFAYLYENIVGDTSDGNDRLIACVDLRTNLGSIDHTLPGDCHSSPFNKVNWANCVSSISVVQPAAYHFCGYDNTSYHTLIVDKQGLTGLVNIPSDRLESYKMINLGPSGTCPAT